MVYKDRRHAGQELAGLLRHLENRPDVVVLALPRGGVPVAYEVACAINAPLDVFLVRKLGVPGQPELAMGAIASGGVRVLNDEVVQALAIPPHLIDAVTEREQSELERRVANAHRLARYVVDLPTDDDDHRHLGNRARQAGQPVCAEVADAQRGGDHESAPRIACRDWLTLVSDGQAQIPLRLPVLRLREFPLAGPVPRLRRVEHASAGVRGDLQHLRGEA